MKIKDRVYRLSIFAGILLIAFGLFTSDLFRVFFAAFIILNILSMIVYSILFGDSE